MRVSSHFMKKKLGLISRKKNMILLFLLGVSATTLSQKIAQAEIMESGDILVEEQFMRLTIGATERGDVSVTDGSVLKRESLIVGNRGPGFLTIESGGIVESGIGILGHNQNGIGTVAVNGPGSIWDSRDFIIIGQFGPSFGQSGSGNLSITNGGKVTSGSGDIAQSEGTVGDVEVIGAGSTWENSLNLRIGTNGTGTLSISDGGSVSNAAADVGAETGGDGSVTVTGATTTWTNNGDLSVGNRGTGALIIEDGGTVTNDIGYVGRDAGASGTVTISGTESTWNNNDALFIGDAGIGKIVLIGNGRLRVDDGEGRIDIGNDVGSNGKLVIGAEPGSEQTAPGTVEAKEIVFGSGTGLIVFNHTSSDYGFSPEIAGDGAISVLAGTTILTGANGYTGGTTITDGTLQIGDGGTSGNLGTGNVENDGTLAFNRSDALTYAGSISGAGSLQQLGSGTTLLSGDSTAFAGNTTIDDGTLRVNGSLGGSVMVGSEAVLGGAGTVGETTVLAGGTLSPGNSIGTLTIDGDLTLHAGSVYEVEVDPTGTSSDLIVVDGIARLAGSVLHIGEAGNYRPFSEYTILTATGGFDGTTFEAASSNFTFLDALLGYSSNAVTLRLERNDIAFARVAATPNQRAVAGGLDSLSFGNALHDAVVMLDAPRARNAFRQLSGESHGSAAAARLKDSGNLRTLASRRFQSAFEGRRTEPTALYATRSGFANPLERKSDNRVWAQAFGSWGRVDGGTNAAGLQHDQRGFLAGIDVMSTDDLRVGLFAGFSRSSFSAAERNSSGSSEDVHLGVHGDAEIGALRLSGGLAHSWHDISTQRSVVFAGFRDTPSASYRGRTAQVFGEAGYRLGNDAFSWEPFAGLAHVRTTTEGFTETGSAAALTAQRSATATSFSTLGVRMMSEFEMAGMPARAQGMVGMHHGFSATVPEMQMSFNGSGDAFSVSGASVARNTGVIEAGVSVGISERAIVNLSYDGVLGGRTRQHGFNARLQMAF